VVELTKNSQMGFGPRLGQTDGSELACALLHSTVNRCRSRPNGDDCPIDHIEANCPSKNSRTLVVEHGVGVVIGGGGTRC